MPLTARGSAAVTAEPVELIVNVSVLELPPPGAGVNTVTRAVPSEAISAALICAVNCVELVNVVGRGDACHCTCDPETNPEPVTVIVNAGPPTLATEGDICVMAGTGLLAAATVNGTRFEILLPRFFWLLEGSGDTTPMLMVPGLAMSVALIAAVNVVSFTKVVGRLLPFHCTVDPETNVPPLTVNVNAGPPAVVAEGVIIVTVDVMIGVEPRLGLTVSHPSEAAAHTRTKTRFASENKRAVRPLRLPAETWPRKVERGTWPLKLGLTFKTI